MSVVYPKLAKCRKCAERDSRCLCVVCKRPVWCQGWCQIFCLDWKGGE